MILREAIFPRLTTVFHDIFDDDGIVVTETLTAREVDEWDSVMHITLMIAVEKEFAIRLSSEEIGNMKTVGELVDIISSRANE